jgi:hypothetical protein
MPFRLDAGNRSAFGANSGFCFVAKLWMVFHRKGMLLQVTDATRMRVENLNHSAQSGQVLF